MEWEKGDDGKCGVFVVLCFALISMTVFFAPALNVDRLIGGPFEFSQMILGRRQYHPWNNRESFLRIEMNEKNLGGGVMLPEKQEAFNAFLPKQLFLIVMQGEDSIIMGREPSLGTV